MDNCIFCKIAAGEIPSATLYEDEEFRVILDLGPASKGHALILPKQHYANLYELPDELAEKVQEILDSIQNDMLETARAHRDAHTYVARTYEEFVQTINEKPGFIKAMWCGCQECEDKIKEDTAATSRCIPFEQEQLSDTCVCCGKPAKKMVYWGRAY